MNTPKYTRSGLLDMLHAGYTNVTFTKVDGTVRVMECTLRTDLIPPAPEPADPAKPKRAVKKNDDVVAVYDTENKGWRSFRIDSVTAAHSLE